MANKKFSLLISCTLIGLLLTSCTASQSYYIEPEFENEKMNTSLLILPIKDTFFDGFDAHTFSQLNPREQAAFDNNLAELISKNSGTKTQEIEGDKSLNKNDFSIDSLEISSGAIGILSPKKGVAIGGKSSAQLVLILDQYYFRTVEQASGGSSYAGHEGTTTIKTLYFETNYLYWDNDSGQAIGWGSVESDLMLKEGLTEEAYQDILDKALKKILKQGPIEV